MNALAGIEVITPPLCAVGESPVWRASEQALYWVDIPARRIHRLHAGTGALASWTLEEMVACVALGQDGRLVAGMESGVFEITPGARGDAKAARLAGIAFPMPGMRFNDGRCDRQGRFWAGTMHMDMAAAHPVGELYCYAGGEKLRGPFEAGLLTQNGLAWSPRGDRMYLSDSHPNSRTIWRYDFDAESGRPRDRRVFVDMRAHPGRPDGATVDTDGCYWTCANDGGAVLRFTPSGDLDRRIDLPVAKPSMCAFGGADMGTLFITTIRPTGTQDDRGVAGAVLALRPGAQGLAETQLRVTTRNENKGGKPCPD